MGRDRLVKPLLVMATCPVVLVKAARLTVEQLLMEMLPALVRLPKEAAVLPAALAFKLMAPEMVVKGMLISVRYWLVAMVIDCALVKLMPFKFWRKVSWMLSAPTVLKPVAQLSTWRLGPRVRKVSEPTLVKLGKVSAPMAVSLSKSRVPPMLARLLAVIAVRLVAPLAVKEPVIDLIPLKFMSPAVPVATAMEPVNVGQPARAVASPPFWMVAVAWLQMSELWPTPNQLMNPAGSCALAILAS